MMKRKSRSKWQGRTLLGGLIWIPTKEQAKAILAVFAFIPYMILCVVLPMIMFTMLGLGPNAVFQAGHYLLVLCFLSMSSLIAVYYLFKNRATLVTPSAAVRSAMYVIGVVLLLGTLINPVNALFLILDTVFLIVLMKSKPYFIFVLMVNLSLIFSTNYVLAGETSITHNFIGLTLAEMKYSDVDHLEYQCHYETSDHTAGTYEHGSINLVSSSGARWDLYETLQSDRRTGFALSRLPHSSYRVDVYECRFDASSEIQKDFADAGYPPERISVVTHSYQKPGLSIAERALYFVLGIVAIIPLLIALFFVVLKIQGWRRRRRGKKLRALKLREKRLDKEALATKPEAGAKMDSAELKLTQSK